MSREELRKQWGVPDRGSDDKPNTGGSNDNAAEQQSAYGLDRTTAYVTSLKLIKRDGHIIYLPYSLQPIVEYVPDEGIFIRTMQQEVHITGRGLTELADHLGEQRVKWLKESTSSMDDETLPICIEGIALNALFP